MGFTRRTLLDKFKFPVFQIVLILVFLLPVYPVKQAVAAPNAVPELGPNSGSRPGGTIHLEWNAVGSTGSGTITYTVKRGLPPTPNTDIITGWNQTSFDDTINPFDQGGVGDTATDGTSWDATNQRYGYTYAYAIMAVDSQGGTTQGAARAYWCDAAPPNIQSYDSTTPVDGGAAKAALIPIKITFNKIDWAYPTNPVGVGTNGELYLHYTVNGGAGGDVFFRMTGTPDTYKTVQMTANLDLTGRANGDVIAITVTGKDLVGNNVTSSLTPKDLINQPFTFTVDTQGPVITSAVYSDNDNNGIDQGDTILITWNEPITFKNPTIADFQLGPGTGGSFGTGATATPGPGNNQLTILLGTNPVLKFVGTPPLINQINVVAGCTTIMDRAENPPSTTPVTITVPTSPRPKITLAQFTDVNNNGIVDSGDTIMLTFSKPVVAGTGGAADFITPVTGDSLGSPVTQTLQADTKKILVTLGAGASLRIAGTFTPGATGAGNPSGIDVALSGNPPPPAGTTIRDEFGNYAEQVGSPPGIDIVGTDSSRPVLQTAVYTDNGSDGLSAGDVLELTFSKPVNFGGEINTSCFSLPVLGDSLDNPVYSIDPANRRILRLTFSTPPKLTVYGVYAGPLGPPSGIDVDSGLETKPDSIFDIYGNTADNNVYRDITSSDTTNPTLSTGANPVVFYDLDSNGPDQGDELIVEFNEPIVVRPQASIADFTVTNGSFGTGATVAAVDTSAQWNSGKKVKITLGAGASLTVAGPNASRVDVANPNATYIVNWAGLVAQNTGGRTITPSTNLGPVITSALYTDNGASGLDAGDTLLLTFDKAISTNAATLTPADFVLPVTNDSLGSSGVSFSTAGLPNNQLRITLGTNCKIRIAGIYNAASTADGSPSGIDVAGGGTPRIEDTTGNRSRQNSPVGVDIGSTDTVKPRLVSAVWTDTSGNGVDAGDTLLLTFSEAITVSPALFSTACFTMPVQQDNLGTIALTNPQPAPTQIRITFTSTPNFTVAGTYNGAIAPGSPSGINISPGIPSGAIYDLAGNTAEPSSQPVDIGSSDVTNPTTLSAVFVDVDSNGVDPGDYIDLTFNEAIRVVPGGTFNFTVTNGNLGTGPTFAAASTNSTNAVLRITLGTNPSLSFGAPVSTIDVAGTITGVTDISGNNAVQSTGKTITAAPSIGPRIVSAVFSDDDNNGIDRGDSLLLTFNKDFNVNGVIADTDFQVLGNSGAYTLGSSTTITFTKVGNNQLRINLGDNPRLQIKGTYTSPTGLPTGIDIAPTGASSIRDTFNQNAVPNTPAGIDITSMDATGPTIVAAYWTDVNSNGVDGGDTLKLVFDEAIIVGTNVVKQCFNVPVTGDNLEFTAYTQSGTKELTLTLQNNSSFTIYGTYSGNNNQGQPSGIGISSAITSYPDCITDLAGNLARVATPVDIGSTDNTGCKVSSAVYQDVNNNATVDVGDKIVVSFNEPIIVFSPTPSNFTVTNGSLGAGGTVQAGASNRVVDIFIGAGAYFTFFGPNQSRIDINVTTNQIKDLSGNNAVQSVAVPITTAPTTGPKVVSASWTDNGAPGVSAGDYITVTFNRDINIVNLLDTDFLLLPSGHSLGTNPSFNTTSNRKEIRITLGTNPNLQPLGIFDPASPQAGPTGIDVAAAVATNGHIYDDFTNNAVQNSPPGKDIAVGDSTPPTLTKAVYRDTDANGVDPGDQLILTFSEPITAPSGMSGITASNFVVTNGSLGTNPAFFWNPATKEVLTISLGVSPGLTVPGVYPGDPGATGININGTISSITDYSGNGATANAGVDVQPYETVGPYVTGARWTDVNNNGACDRYDYVYVRFNKPVIVGNPVTTDFYLPVVNDTWGGGATFIRNPNDPNEVRITLGAAVKLTPVGIYNGSTSPGSPSGVDVGNGTPGSTIATVTDVYGNHAYATTPKDIDDGRGPYITAAYFYDVDRNGIDPGDHVAIQFNEPITIDTGRLTAQAFDLRVFGDQFGSPSLPIRFFMVPGQDSVLWVECTTGVMLTVWGTFSESYRQSGYPSGINLSNNMTPGAIKDVANNNAVPSPAAVDLQGSETVPPTLVRAQLKDLDGNGPDVGDQLYLTFSEPMIYRAYYHTDFNLPVQNDSLGSDPTFVVDATSKEIIICTLGTGAKLRVDGTYNPANTTAGNPSGIDVSISMRQYDFIDIMGNTAVPSTVKDIEPVTDAGPLLLAANFYDPDNNGPDQGDIIALVFNRAMRVSSSIPLTDLKIPVAGDSLGGSGPWAAAIGTTPVEIAITLGANPTLTIAGTFTTGAVTAGSPSGIGVRNVSDNITDRMGLRPQDTTPVDISAFSTTGPKLLKCWIVDTDRNGIVSGTDRLVLEFDKPITINRTALEANPAAHIRLPVGGDTFGPGATFEVNFVDLKQLYIGLQTGAVLTVEGIFSSSNTGAGSPSGIGIMAGTDAIRDLAGNNAQGGTFVDIEDRLGPYVTRAVYYDVNGDGIGLGDRISVYFNENILFSSQTTGSDFALSEPTDSLGSPVSVAQGGSNFVNITVGSGARFTVGGVYPTDPGASGIDLSTTFVAGRIRDTLNNSAIRTTFKDIEPSDTTPPETLRARYVDVNLNGVDAGDQIIVTFTKPIYVNGATRSDFDTVNGNLGTGGITAVTRGPLTTEVTITLGPGAVLTIEGIYPTDPTASAIDIGAGYVAGHIVDASGNNVRPSTPKDIQDTLGPVLRDALYIDVNDNGVDQGDRLKLTFSETVVVGSGISAAGFSLPVAGDDLGANPTFAKTNTSEITITLGRNATFTVAGVYTPGMETRGSPSGINVIGPYNQITDPSGNPARSAAQAVDIRSSDTIPPTLVSVIFKDEDGNGVDEGDTLTLEFSEAMSFSSQIVAADFNVINGSLGNNPSFRRGTSAKYLIITLGPGASLNIAGVYPAGSASGIARSATTYVSGHITDIGGNDWPAGPAVDIGSADVTGPYIIRAIYVDTNGNGISQGDRVDITFNEPVIIDGAVPDNILLPVNGDNWGAGATIVPSSENTTISVITGTGVNLRVKGTFAQSALAAGSPSGVNINGSITTIMDISGNPAVQIPAGVDIGSNDSTAPRIIEARLTGNLGVNLVDAQSDLVTLVAVFDDSSLKTSDIKADFSQLGGPSGVSPASYTNYTATWNAITTGSLRGTLQITITAEDFAGNGVSYVLTVYVVQPAGSVIGEIVPKEVLRNSGSREFTLYLKPAIETYHTGVNEIVIGVPIGTTPPDERFYRDIDVTASTLTIGSDTYRLIAGGTPLFNEALVTVDATAGKITITLGEKLDSADSGKVIAFTFKATVPKFKDEPVGKVFTVTVDDSTDRASIAATAGNANGVADDSDTLTVQTIGVRVLSVEDRLVITPDFWKVVFIVKFNVDMNCERAPRVTFKPANSLTNEQVLTQLSFVNASWMGYGIIPYESGGFKGEYILTFNELVDYTGGAVETLTFRQKFSPKFIIAAYMNPMDERTLIVNARFLPADQTEVLASVPRISVTQVGTKEVVLQDVIETSRSNVFKGTYLADTRCAGRAAIEIEGRLAGTGRAVKGKALTEFSSAMISPVSGGSISSPDDVMQVLVPPQAFKKERFAVITPDFSKLASLFGEKAFAREYSGSDQKELVKVSDAYVIYPAGARADKPMTLRFREKKGLKGNAGIFGWDAGTKKWKYYPTGRKEGIAETSIDTFGTYVLMRDELGPRFRVESDLSLEQGSELVVSVTDAGSGVDKNRVKAYVDGRIVSSKYDPEKNQLVIYLPKKLAGGEHSLEVEAADRLGNVARLSDTKFLAPGFFGIIEMMTYPNPAKTTATLHYVLGKTVEDVEIKIFDVAGDVVFEQGGLPASNAAARVAPFVWNLRDMDGEDVANGVYIYRLKLTDTDGSVLEERGKIAVLR